MNIPKSNQEILDLDKSLDGEFSIVGDEDKILADGDLEELLEQHYGLTLAFMNDKIGIFVDGERNNDSKAYVVQIVMSDDYSDDEIDYWNFNTIKEVE